MYNLGKTIPWILGALELSRNHLDPSQVMDRTKLALLDFQDHSTKMQRKSNSSNSTTAARPITPSIIRVI